MEKLHYWLLQSVLYDQAPLDALTNEESAQGWFGYSPPYSDLYNELVPALLRFFESGDLIALSEINGEFIVPGFKPTPLQVLNGLLRKEIIYYGLTPQGGARWETYVNADWSKLIYAAYTDNIRNFIPDISGEDGFFCMLRSGSYSLIQQTITRYFESGLEIAPGTQIWTRMTPWHATYWKNLDVGHRLIFRFQHEFQSYQEADLMLRIQPQWYSIPEFGGIPLRPRRVEE